MPSRTAMVLRNQGDPIFGALAKVALRGIRGIGRLIGGGRRAGGELVRSPQTGELVRRGAGAVSTIARSRTARIVAEGAGFGTVAAAAGEAFRRFRGTSQFTTEGGFQLSPEGCPIGKVVEVAAHQRIIPLDRFGRPRRRIDVLNTKALSRATRRLGGFQKRARRVEKQLARIAPRSRSRRRSKGVC